MNTTDTKNQVMDSFVGAIEGRPAVGTIVEGPVIIIEPKAVYVDLAPYGTGIIYGREFVNARSIIKKVNVGDTIEAKITEHENEDGYVELSLKEALKPSSGVRPKKRSRTLQFWNYQ